MHAFNPIKYLLTLLTATISAVAIASDTGQKVAGADISTDGESPYARDLRLESLMTIPIESPIKLDTNADIAKARTNEASNWLIQAEKLRVYQEDNTTSIRNRKEARHLEYNALLNAERAGNQSKKEHRMALLQEIRSDLSLLDTQRCEAVANTKYFELRNQQMTAARRNAADSKEQRDISIENASVPSAQKSTFEARLASYADIERSLIREFPNAPNGYAGLLNIANDCSVERGKAIVNELLAAEEIPAEVKTQAIVMRARFALVGRYAPELAPSLELDPNSETWLYTYSKAQPSSIALAQTLAANKPNNVELVGICLDGSDANPNLAESSPNKSPPGRIVRSDGVVSASLVLTSAGLAYGIGDDGCILTINLINDLRTLWKAEQMEGSAK